MYIGQTMSNYLPLHNNWFKRASTKCAWAEPTKSMENWKRLNIETFQHWALWRLIRFLGEMLLVAVSLVISLMLWPRLTLQIIYWFHFRWLTSGLRAIRVGYIVPCMIIIICIISYECYLKGTLCSRIQTFRSNVNVKIMRSRFRSSGSE